MDVSWHKMHFFSVALLQQNGIHVQLLAEWIHCKKAYKQYKNNMCIWRKIIYFNKTTILIKLIHHHIWSAIYNAHATLLHTLLWIKITKWRKASLTCRFWNGCRSLRGFCEKVTSINIWCWDCNWSVSRKSRNVTNSLKFGFTVTMSNTSGSRCQILKTIANCVTKWF